MKYKAIIFDLDGVMVTTDDFHYKAWKRLSDEDDLVFNREINEELRGVSRMESLDNILKHNPGKTFTSEQKLEMATRKNDYYRDSLAELSPRDVLVGVLDFIAEAKTRGLLLSTGSSSRNAPMILEKTNLLHLLDATADGNEITNSKPHPEVFLLAAERLGVDPKDCLVVEDAKAGVDAALAGGMDCLGVGAAANEASATYRAEDLSKITVAELLSS